MEETWVSLGGAQLYVATVGEGPAALVMPVAWGMSHRFHRALLGDLEIPLRLTYFDTEGTGGSGPLPAGWDPARILDEAEAVRQAVSPHHPMVLIGHASGAFLSLAYGLDHPGAISAMILISPFASYERASSMSVTRVEARPQWKMLQRRVKEIRAVSLSPEERFRAIFKEQRVIDTHDYGPHYFQMADAADEADFNPLMKDDEETDLLDELSAITAPVLLVTGEDDPLSPLEESRLIAAELPFVRLVEIPRCGHYPYVEEPELFTAAVQGFLADIEGEEN